MKDKTKNMTKDKKVKEKIGLDQTEVWQLCEASGDDCGLFHDTALIVAAQLERDGHLETATEQEIAVLVNEAWREVSDPDQGSDSLLEGLNYLARLISEDHGVRDVLAGHAKELDIEGLSL